MSEKPIHEEDFEFEEPLSENEQVKEEVSEAAEEKSRSASEEKPEKKEKKKKLSPEEEKLIGLEARRDELLEAKAENRFLTDALRPIAGLQDEIARKKKILELVQNDPDTEVIREVSAILLEFKKAVEDSEKSRDFDEMIASVERIYSDIHSLFEKFGVKPIESEGLEFDPNLHEAMMMESRSDIEFDTTVTQEFEKGYTMNDQVIRTAKVKVAKKG